MAHSIGKTIAELRKAKGWTQIELAEKLNVSDKAVSKWESEGGFPEITQLPVLAKIFDVSIDYLMTGTETAPEVIAMSKIELCAKNDDVEMLKTIDFRNGYEETFDEDRETIITYIIKYQSVKLFQAIVRDMKKLYAYLANYYGTKELYDGASLLALKCNLSYDFPACYFGEKSYSYLLFDSNCPKELCLNFFNGKLRTKEKGYHLMAALKICYLASNMNMFTFLLEQSAILNQGASTIQFIKVKVEESIIKDLLEKGEIELVEKINSINKLSKGYVASADEIRIAKLKLDKSITKEELAIQSTIHSGVICIDELLELKDFKLIQKVLNEYPIHFIEKLIAYVHQNDWRALFQYAIDNNDLLLADVVIKNNYSDIEKRLLAIWNSFECTIVDNKKHLYVIEDGRKVELWSERYGRRLVTPKTVNEIALKLQEVKKRIIDELSLKLDKEKTIGDLTKEYFEDELAKGNVDMVIIKLCVRLEAILRCDYQYEGDLSEMLKKYCDSKLYWQEDDGWGYMVNKSDDKTIRLLNNLRIKRNSIVHSEKTKITLSLDDIQYCIDYICKMG